ncbi:MAG TPA: PEP-CTERM sorting domain-containing protein [Bryobacteraceae bacterium]|nr:PEP-CTERM sorting domain-containing protein [Bryobacteraceae bacterium]
MKAFSGTIVALLLLFTVPGVAAPVGNFSTGITPGGGVTGSAALIDWYLPFGGGFGDFTTGASNIGWSGGTLTAATNPYGRITDLVVGPPVPVINFIQFYAGLTHNPGVPGSGVLQALPAFDLLSVGPGAPTNCTVDPGLNNSCSPFVTASSSPIGPYMSPIILTQRANGTDISMNLNMLGRDATGSIPWTGLVTAQIAGQTPSQIQATINDNRTINLTSWSLNANSIPEPATLAFVGSGLVVLGFVARRRKK